MTAGREQLLLDLGHRPSLAAEDFLAAPGNREALAWLARWPDWPGPALVLHGPEGAGKSHLARIFAARTGARHLEPGAAGGALEVGPREVRILDPAVPVRDEVALLQLYNRLHEQRGHLLLVAREPVARWRLELPDLASRLLAAPAAPIGPPDDALLAALLVKQFADRQVAVGDEVVHYLVSRMERSYAAAQRLPAALDALAMRERRPITVALARRLLDPPTD